MNPTNWIFEMGATFIESTVVLSAVTCICTKRYRKNYLLLFFLFSLAASILIDGLNHISIFSYVTPIIAMAFVIFVSSKILCNASVVLRSLSAILSYLIIQSVDYIVLILFGHFTGNPEKFFTLFVTATSVNRFFFIITVKLIDIFVYFLFQDFLPRISKLSPRLRVYLLILVSISYIVMQCLFQAILVPNLAILQLAVVASWCFLIGFIIAFIAFFLSLTKQEQDRQRLEMLRSENVMMAENYKTLHATQQSYARTVHDFKHHVTTMRDLLSNGKVQSALHYTDSLLMTSYQQATQCHSGNDIVDAIINSKLSEAKAEEIQFTFVANLHTAIQIDSIDLCGILANQLENAFEACENIPDSAKRLVHVEIKQAQSFIILRVENTVLSDPFAENPDLKSTKPASSAPHGYGLLNIRSIAQKYEGTLRTEFVNGKFVSVVSLCDIPFDTNNSTVG